MVCVHKNTYARWEREEVPVSSDALAVMISEGWNANWVLTGAGPERLDQLRVAETQARYQSHVLRVDLLTMAVELIDSELERAKKKLSPQKRATAYGLIYEELLEPGELPSAKIVQLVIKALA